MSSSGEVFRATLGDFIKQREWSFIRSVFIFLKQITEGSAWRKARNLLLLREPGISFKSTFLQRDCGSITLS